MPSIRRYMRDGVEYDFTQVNVDLSMHHRDCLNQLATLKGCSLSQIMRELIAADAKRQGIVSQYIDDPLPEVGWAGDIQGNKRRKAQRLAGRPSVFDEWEAMKR
jgi:hypothetical protein